MNRRVTLTDEMRARVINRCAEQARKAMRCRMSHLRDLEVGDSIEIRYKFRVHSVNGDGTKFMFSEDGE